MDDANDRMRARTDSPADGDGMNDAAPPWWASPGIGNAFTVASGVVFLIVCMMLPLVGPAATRGSGSPGAGPAPYLAANRMAFTSVLTIATLLAFGALAVKLAVRRYQAGAWPWTATALVFLCVSLAAVCSMGLLEI